MSPKLKLPLLPLHCPGFPEKSDFIALDCPQFGNRIGDSCPALPSVTQPLGDRFGDAGSPYAGTASMQASCHTGFSMMFGLESCQAGLGRGTENPPSEDDFVFTSP